MTRYVLGILVGAVLGWWNLRTGNASDLGEGPIAVA